MDSYIVSIFPRTHLRDRDVQPQYRDLGGILILPVINGNIKEPQTTLKTDPEYPVAASFFCLFREIRHLYVVIHFS